MSRPNLGPKKKKKKAGGAGKVVEVKLPDPETVKLFLTFEAKILMSLLISHVLFLGYQKTSHTLLRSESSQRRNFEYVRMDRRTKTYLIR